MARINAFVICALTLLVSLPGLAQPEYDKSFIQSEMSRYKAVYGRSVSQALSTTNIDARYYRLNISITTNPQYLRGSVLMRALSRQSALDAIQLDLMSSMIVDSVKVGGVSVSFEQFPSTVGIALDHEYNEGDEMTVEVFYRGTPGSSGFGSFEFSNHLATPWVWSLSEPYGAKDWWPCNDHPSDKADSTDMFATVDTAFKVGSNGKLMSIVDNGNGTHTYHWHESYPISTYLISVAITNYAAFSNWFKYSPTDSMEVLNYVLPEHLASAQSQLPVVVDELRIYSDLFGLYPFITEKYGHSEFGWGGGMEHQTMTSLGGFSASLTAHELAHQWFGDMITCRTWPHVWLNEGFATFCEHLFECAEYGEASYWSGINANMSSAKGASGSTYIADSGSVGSLFDWNRVYAKGSVILHMLRHVIGDTAFFHSMRNYANDPRFRFGTATTEDFQGVCEATSGQSLGYFFSEWVYGLRYPHYYVGWSADSTSGGYLVSIGVNQTTGTTTPSYFTMPVDIRLRAPGMDTTVTVFNNAQTQTFAVTVPARPLSVQLDPGGWIMKDVDTLSAFLVTPSYLQMKSVAPSGWKLDSVTVRNTGSNTLSILSVTTNDAAFSVSPQTASISPGGSSMFVVRFSPDVVGTRYARAYFNHNQSGSPGVLAVGGTALAGTFDLPARWNIVSIPYDAGNCLMAANYPLAISRAYWYNGGDGYVPVETLCVGQGYWAKFNSPQQYTINGRVLDADSFDVRAGWNLIGSISFPVLVSHITSDPPGIVTSRFFGYNGSYSACDTIRPPWGYWVKANQDGRLILSSAGSPTAASRIQITPGSERPPAPPEEEVASAQPLTYGLHQAYPNPFNPRTHFQYTIAAAQFVSLKVFDVLGRDVATLVNEVKRPGVYSVEWDATSQPSGVYYYRLMAGSFVETKKAILIR